MKSCGNVCALILFFLVGIYVSVFMPTSLRDLPKTDLASNGISRDPAAIKRTYDFSGLEGSALAFATKQRLLAGVKVVRSPEGVGLELGHFVLKGQDGQKTFACQRYGKVMLTFVGDGSAVSGELPKMEVEGNCEMSSDINSISALRIPIAKILGEPVAEGEFNFRDDQPVSIRFANVLDQWPRTWQLQAIRLFDSTQKDEVVIPAKELRDILPKPVLLNW